MCSLQNIYKNVVSLSGMRISRLRKSYFNVSVVVVVTLLVCINESCGQMSQARLEQPASTIHRQHPRFDSQKSLKADNDENFSTQDIPRKLEGKDDLDGNSLPSPKTLFVGEDGNGVPIVVGTWFRIGSYTLAFAMFGTGFLISCAAAAVYYVLFVVTEPSQQVRSMKRDSYNGWTTAKVLRALQIAYDTYQTFDPYSPICQLKTVCEIQESGYFEGSVLKRISHFLVHTDLIENRLRNVADLRAADRIGNDPKEKCEEKFQDCRFSLNKLYESYMTVM